MVWGKGKTGDGLLGKRLPGVEEAHRNLLALRKPIPGMVPDQVGRAGMFA